MSKTDHYHKGELKGGITEQPFGFTAFTAENSKDFSTYSAADRWIRKAGYVPGEPYLSGSVSGRCGSTPKKEKKRARVKGVDNEIWVLSEYNYARRETVVKDYSYDKTKLLDRVMYKYSDYAFNHNDKEMIDIYDNAENSEDLFRKDGSITEDKELYSINLGDDYNYSIELITPKNKNRILADDDYGVLRNVVE